MASTSHLKPRPPFKAPHSRAPTPPAVILIALAHAEAPAPLERVDRRGRAHFVRELKGRRVVVRPESHHGREQGVVGAGRDADHGDRGAGVRAVHEHGMECRAARERALAWKSASQTDGAHVRERGGGALRALLLARVVGAGPSTTMRKRRKGPVPRIAAARRRRLRRRRVAGWRGRG